MILAGIDADLSGGLVCIQFPEKKVLDCRSMPSIKMDKGRRLDNRAVHTILQTFAKSGCKTIAVEKAIVKPQFGKAGATMQGGVGTTHQTSGGLLALCEINFERVHPAWPSSWKKQMGVTSDKDQTREKAIDLMPSMAHVFKLKKNTGIAEAALLCFWLYGFKKCI